MNKVLVNPKAVMKEVVLNRKSNVQSVRVGMITKIVKAIEDPLQIRNTCITKMCATGLQKTWVSTIEEKTTIEGT